MCIYALSAHVHACRHCILEVANSEVVARDFVLMSSGSLAVGVVDSPD